MSKIARLFLIFAAFPAVADAFDVTSVKAMLESSCIGCHDSSTDTPLNLDALSSDLTDADTFRSWQNIYDRVRLGEMPPPDEARPDVAEKDSALKLLREQLVKVNREAQQTRGRVPSRRLTRNEYEHSLHDLLGIGGNLAKYLPPENQSGAFDVVAAKQDISSVQIRGLLKAAGFALEEAIQLGPRPNMDPRKIDYLNSSYIQMWIDRPIRRGGGTIFKTNEDVVTFRGENYVLRSDHNGIRFPVAGRYRITVTAAAHQPRSSITVSLKRQNDKQGESELFAAWDLVGDDYRTVSTTKYLRPDDYIYVSADELDPDPDGKVIYNIQPASSFKGEGVKIREVMVEGPLETSWPPNRTHELFTGIEWKARDTRIRQARAYDPVLTKSPQVHLREIVAKLAPRAFRRHVSVEEIDAMVALANPSLNANRDFIECATIPLRAILVSPDFLFHTGPAGKLDDIDLASRLSFFLWRSIPDDQLFQLAIEGKLSDPAMLKTQVDRMLDDPKHDRFVNEFLDQWLELERIDATTPDASMYPEYDDVLRRAMLAETRTFFAHLIDENLGIDNLIDSDFTFLNRKLAEHYGINHVEGEVMRRVELDRAGIRGGILTHASIAKVTANGTVTSPIKRGNFVLTNLLGQPPNPPPAGVGSIEPDTRGATTIRETLAKHRTVDTCAACHRRIDPPGFALECFDPVGTFRERYRHSRNEERPTPVGLRFSGRKYDLGHPVDTSGVTDDGFKFSDIRAYKKHLLKSNEQVARNVVSLLITFATGGEIEFADRAEVERIVLATKDDGYPLRSLIHHVVKNRLFRNR